MVSFASTHPAPDEVVISGIGGIFPKSENLNEFEINLLSNTNLVEEILEPNWQRDKLGVPRKRGTISSKNKFDATFFSISYAQALRMDPLIRKILEKSFEAIIDSGVTPSDFRNTNTAVIIGAFVSESESLWMCSGDEDSGLGITGHNRSMLANRMSYWLNTTGPSYSYFADETAGILGLEIAQELIKTRQCDSAIVGTVNFATLPETTFSYLGLGYLSSDGKCRAFDANGTGYAKSEACVVLHLQRAETAKRIYATVVHAQTFYNGSRNAAFVRPVGDHILQFIEGLYEKCGIDPTEISYLEASGCGLQVYEEAEIKAVSKVLLRRRKSPLLTGSVKSNIGHAGAAASLCSIAKVLIAMERGVIPASIHYETPGSHISALAEGRLKVVTENTKWIPGLAAINSMDMTGAFGHVILRPYMKIKSPKGEITENLPTLVCLSGRNEEGTKEIVDKVKALAHDSEFVGLLQDVYSSNISNHNYRSYIVTSTILDMTQTEYFDGSKRPVWFVFSGMGSQWPGMATHLMKLPVIAETIQKCHTILQPKGLDLIKLLMSEDPNVYDNILYSFVGIAAVQLALVETLRLLNIKPDGIIGHSVGELGCAYVDGCFTMEQMILAAYYRGMASLEAEIIEGRMAAIGIGYKNIKDLLPPDIEVACHNSEDSCTISGPAEAVTQFVTELKTNNIFAKEVNVSNIAYHSRYIKPAAPRLLAYLRNVIPEPKLRSPCWYSTSAPEELWNTYDARYSSAEYHTNNLLNPVLFEEMLKHIPKNAILIEIAPHGLLQAILKRSMGADCVNIPLSQRGNEQNLEFLLSAIGKLYLAGMVPRVSALYPPVQFPVSRGTPSISPLVSWDHSKTWRITSDIKLDEKRALERNVRLTLNSERYRILKDYVVNGQIILPVAAVLVLLWKELGNMISRNYVKMPVVFENTHFYYVPVFTNSGSLHLCVFLQRATGNFEIFEDGKDQLIAKGRLRTVKDVAAEFSKEPKFNVTDAESLTSHDVYTELENRGFEYGEQFRRIRKVTLSIKGSEALIDWSDDWTVSIDSILQLVVLQATENKHLHMPTFIRKVVIDPLGEMTKASTNATVAVFHNVTNTARCRSIEVSGMITKAVHLERPFQVTLSTFSFVPFKKYQFQNIYDFTNRAIQLLQNNSIYSKSAVTLTVLCNEKTGNGIEPQVEKIFEEKKNIKVSIKTLYVAENQNTSDATFGGLLLTNDSTVEQGIMLLRNCGGFMLATVTSTKNLKYPNDVAIIDEQYFEDEKWIFLKKCGAVSRSTPVLVLPKIKCFKPSEMFTEETSIKQYIVLENISLDEVKAFAANVCTGKIRLRKSYRFVFIVDSDAPPFSPTSNFYQEQLSLDLVINVCYEGAWGSFITTQVLLSLTPDNHFNKIVSSLRVKDFNWSYIGVNTQNLKTRREEDNVTGVLDLSGYTTEGQKIMCLVHMKPGYVQMTTWPHLMWPVPDAWSLEDAATVPFVYSLAYYALVLKADARSGENILIHAGHTPTGQAFISVALKIGLGVCTTVSNNKQRQYLRKKFPQILDSDIYDLYSKSWEAYGQRKSKNKGFRIVVNTLEEPFLQKSVDSMCTFGRLLQLCTTEMEQNTDLGMQPFLKNLGFISIIPETMFDMNPVWKARLHHMVADGIKTGVVQPLDREMFTVATETEILSQLDDFDCTKKFLISKISSYAQQVIRSSRPQLKNSYCKTMFPFGSNDSYLIIGDAPENCLVFADWLVSRGCRYITICCNSSEQANLTNRRVRILRMHSDACIEIVSIEKTYTLENSLNLLRGINNNAPLSAIFILSVTEPLSVYLLEVALCSADLGTPSVVLINSDITTVKQMRKSTGLTVLDIHMSNKMKGTELKILCKVLDELLLSKPSESIYLSVEEKGAATCELLSEDQLPNLLPSSIEQLERLGEELLENTPSSLEELCTKSPRLLHVREVHPVFIIPGLQCPAKPTAEVLARNLMYPAVVVKLPAGTDSLQDDVAAIIPAITHIQAKGPYNIVGIYWGGIYAIELAKQLQAKGEKTQVFLLEGAPQANQDIAKLLGDGDELQVNLLIWLLSLTPNTIYKEKLSLPGWNSRLQTALSELPQMSVTRKHYLHFAIDALYRKIETLLCYKPNGLLLCGQVVLIRPNTQSDDSCGLEKFFKESLNVILVDCDHKSLLECSEVADIISDMALVDLYWINHRS